MLYIIVEVANLALACLSRRLSFDDSVSPGDCHLVKQ